MAKYYPEPAPFTLTEREQEFMDYITRELNRVSQTLLDAADISLDEKFVAPDRPQIGQLIYADGVSFNPTGDGPGFYGYDGSNWHILGLSGASAGTFVAKAGDTMSGDLEINKASASVTGITLVNSNTAGAMVIGSSSGLNFLFETGDSIAFTTDSRANIDSHTYGGGTAQWSLNSTNGDVSQRAGGRLIPKFASASAIANATGSLGMVEIQGVTSDAGSAAFMTFHRPGAFAAYFGLDTDNTFKVGGWSMGANSYKILHEGLASGATFVGLHTFSAGIKIDTNYYKALQSSNPVDSMDSNDYYTYDRTNNRHEWIVGGTEIARISTAGIDARSGTFLLAGTAIPFVKAFESSQQTITAAGALTLAHSLGVKPKLYMAVIVCITAELGYSIGDEVIVNPSVHGSSAESRGLSLVPDATNINVRFGSGTVMDIINKSNGNVGGITAANWKLIVRAWA